MLTKGNCIGYLFKPKFQYFELPHRKYKSFKRIKVEDSELRNFISNRGYNNPADKDLTMETTVLRGGILDRIRRSSEDLQLPSCFGFTPKTKVQVLSQFLGGKDLSMCWQQQDVKKLIQTKYNAKLKHAEAISKLD